MERKSMMKNERRKVKNNLNKHQKESTTDFEMMDRSSESLKRLLKSKGKKEDAMKFAEHVVDKLDEQEQWEKLKKAEKLLSEGRSHLNSLTYSLFQHFADPNKFLDEEDLNFFLDEEVGGRDEESVAKYKNYCWQELFRSLNTAYTYASKGLDLIKEVYDTLEVEPKILTQEEIDDIDSPVHEMYARLYVK